MRENFNEYCSKRLFYLLGLIPFCIPSWGLPGSASASELVSWLIVALISLILLISSSQHNQQNSILISPITIGLLLIAFGIVIQSTLRYQPYFSTWLPATTGLLSLALLSALIGNVIETKNRAAYFSILCAAILTGGWANALLALTQTTINLLDDNNLKISGFLNQRNLLSNYLFLALISSCWLTYTKKIHPTLTLITVIFFSIIIGWSGSRSPILYALIVIFICIIFSIRSIQTRDFAVKLLCMCLLFFVFQLFAPALLSGWTKTLNSTSQMQKVSSTERFTKSGGNSDIGRLIEWKKSLQIIEEHPLNGVGWGNYARQSVLLDTTPPFSIKNRTNFDIFTHSHNIILQLFAELGAPLAMATLFLTGWGIISIVYGSNSPDRLAAISLIIVVLIHSMVEFTLWNYHFLAIFIVIATLFSYEIVCKTQIIKFRGHLTNLVIAAVVALIISASVLANQYYIATQNARPSWLLKTGRAHVKELESIKNNPLIDFAVAGSLLWHFEPKVPVNNIDQIAQDLALSYPVPSFLIAGAIFSYKQNNIKDGKDNLRIIALRFPNFVAHAKKKINTSQDISNNKKIVMLSEIDAYVSE
ncbi:Wzy polymerase domain-containing protein [Chitinibacteraceae bacterium HSL-7]